MSENVKIKVLSKPFVLKGVKNVFDVLFSIETKKKDDSVNKRENFNLAIVLDRSGSMDGESIENAKIAITKVIESLTTKDRLHLIVYDDTSEIIFEDGSIYNKQSLIESLKSIKTRNCTNMIGGLELAYKILLKSEISPPKRIFLFSDGKVNSGITSHRKIFKKCKEYHSKNINITSFGIGADFDEGLMKGIAEYGHGDYFYIKDGTCITAAVSKATQNMTALIGKNANLQVVGMNGANVIKAISYKNSALINGIKLGDLLDNDIRHVLFEVEMIPIDKSCKIITYELIYDSLDGKTKIILKSEMDISITNDRDRAKINCDEVDVAKSIALSSLIDIETIKLVEKNNFVLAIEKQKESLNMLIKNLKKDKTGILKLAIKRKEELVERIKQKKDIESMKKDIGYSSYQCRTNSISSFNK